MLCAGAAVLRHILCGQPAAAPAQRRSVSLQAHPFSAAPAGEAHRDVSVPYGASARSPRPPTSAALSTGGGGGGAAAAAAAAATAALGADWPQLSARLALLGQQVRPPFGANMPEGKARTQVSV